MNIEGLDYNTTREKLRLMAYGRNLQQMVEMCMALPTKRERQKCAEEIITVMRRAIPSTQSQKDRMPVLWYHLALMSDFKLDIDYPVEIVYEDKMAQRPDNIPYSNMRRMPVRHYGRLIFEMFEQLKSMPEGPQRDALVNITAAQMYRSLQMWGMATVDKEKVASDLARFTDGVIQVMPQELKFETSGGNAGKKKKRKK